MMFSPTMFAVKPASALIPSRFARFFHLQSSFLSVLRKNIILAAFNLLLTLGFAALRPNEAQAQCAPAITAVFVNDVRVGEGGKAIGGSGTNMIIFGRNFTPSSRILINSAPQITQFVSSTELRFSVGTAASGSMFVETPGCGLSNGFPFEFLRTVPPPIIYSVTPLVLPAGRTVRVVVVGEAFTRDVVASVNGVPVRIVETIQASDFTNPDRPIARDSMFLELTCIAGQLLLRNTNPDADPVRSTALYPFPFQCVTPTVDAPRLDGFSPMEGGPQTEIGLQGSFPGGVQSVRIGRSPAAIVSTNPLRVIPGAEGRSGLIEITTPGGTVVSTAPFTFVQPPVITSVTPRIIGTGATVFIRGRNLSRANVNFGGVIPISVVNTVSDTVITAVIGTVGTITRVYPNLPIDNVPVNIQGRGGSVVAPERVIFVDAQFRRPMVSVKAFNPVNGARLDAAQNRLTLHERRATFYRPEPEQRGDIIFIRRNWNLDVNVQFRVSYRDTLGNQMITRGLSLSTRQTNEQIGFPIPPVPQSQIPFFPMRDRPDTSNPFNSLVNGFWGDLLPTFVSTNRRLNQGDNAILIPGTISTFEFNRLDTAAFRVRARWSDLLYRTAPERFTIADASFLGRQGRRTMTIEVLSSPDDQYDVDPTSRTAEIVFDDPIPSAPDVINPIPEQSVFAGSSGSMRLEARTAQGSTELRAASDNSVLPRDVFYDNNYLPLTYTVRTSDSTLLTARITTSSASEGSNPQVTFTLSPNAVSGSTAAVIIVANNGLGGIATHQFIVRAQQGAPIITGFSPAAGRVGSVVTLTGRDFGANPRVSFSNGAGGTVSATPTSANDTQIVVSVPNGAETGRISVANSIATGTTQTEFVLVRTPQITGFTPDSAAQGSTVTIRGSGFLGAHRVMFGSQQAANFQVVSDGEIRAVLSSAGASGLISIVNPLDSGRSQNQFVFFAPPSIQAVSPATAGAGATLTVTGVNFSGTSFNAPSSVRIGDRDASFAVLSPTQMSVTMPDFGMNDVPNLALTITTRGGSTTASQRLTYVPCPTIDAFSPPSGSVQTILTISGSGLQAVTGVNVGGVAVREWSLVSPTRIIATVGSVESGEVQLVAGRCTIAAPGRFTFQVPSRPLLIQPASFSRIFPGAVQVGSVRILNQSAGAVNVNVSLMQNDGSFTLGTPSMLTLPRNGSATVSLTFAPASGGAKRVTLSAAIQGGVAVQGSVTVDTLQTAQAGVWEVQSVNFDTIRAGRSTLRAVLITNRDVNPARLDAASLPSDGAFRIAGALPRWFARGETAAIILRAQPSVTQQRLQSALTVVGAQDSAVAMVTAFSRAQFASDIVVEARIVPERNSLAPGQNNALRMEITNVQNLPALIAGNPRWQGSARFAQTSLLPVLHENTAKPAPQGQFTLQRGNDSRNPLQRILFAPQAFTLSGQFPAFLANVPVGVYLGSDSASNLELEEMSISLGNSPQKVFVEEAQAGSAFGRFTAQFSGRVIQRIQGAVLNVISPNPAQNLVSVKFSVPKETAVILSLVNARGTLIQNLAEGWFQAGEHGVDFDASAIPSGSYMIMLHSERERISKPLQLVR